MFFFLDIWLAHRAVKRLFNTFSVQHLIFEGKKGTISNLKIYKKFLVKIVIQTPYVKFDAFSGRNASFSLIKQSDEK